MLCLRKFRSDRMRKQIFSAKRPSASAFSVGNCIEFIHRRIVTPGKLKQILRRRTCVEQRGIVSEFRLNGKSHNGNDCRLPVTHIKGEINKEGIRKMTPREWARLQGFPDDYVLPLADVHLYKQFGNSVTVPVIKAIAQKIREVLENG